MRPSRSASELVRERRFPRRCSSSLACTASNSARSMIAWSSQNERPMLRADRTASRRDVEPFLPQLRDLVLALAHDDGHVDGSPGILVYTPRERAVGARESHLNVP